MKTSEDANKSGVYASECCEEELIFMKGDTLWRCPRCHGLCQWELISTIEDATKELPRAQKFRALSYVSR